MSYRYGYTYVRHRYLRYRLVAVGMYLNLCLHGHMYEVDSYKGSFSKWYLLRGAKHPGMAMIDQP